ncbi:MAG: hypothetical protein HYX94_12305 [Chloroflexi bacterium]|nr:hypothetical protein [Chloroflexota bacterium]
MEHKSEQGFIKPLVIMLVALIVVVAVGVAYWRYVGPRTTATSASVVDYAKARAAVTEGKRVAYEPGRNLAYIANVMDPTISVLDLDKLTLVDSIVFRDLKGKQQGHFLSISPDGRYAWISEDISANGGFVQVIDLATGAQVKKFDVGAGVANYVSRDGKYLFTSSTKTNNINVFDMSGQKYLGDFPIGSAPHVVDSSPDGKVLWTTDSSGNLRSFDATGLPGKMPTALDSIKIGGTLHAVLVHPNGKYVFVGSDQSGDNVVDVASKSIVAKIPGKPHNYEISPDGKYLLSGEIDYPT